MSEIEFRTAWRQQDPALINDAKEFWRGLDVMSPEDIEARAKELCALVYANGKVIAVSTAAPFDFPRLRACFAYYRTVVAPDFRGQRLAFQLFFYSHNLLVVWARENPEMKIKGIYIVFQAEEFHNGRYVAVERRHGVDFVLIGYTPDGDRVRVVWFDDAIV